MALTRVGTAAAEVERGGGLFGLDEAAEVEGGGEPPARFLGVGGLLVVPQAAAFVPVLGVPRAIHSRSIPTKFIVTMRLPSGVKATKCKPIPPPRRRAARRF